MKYFGFFLIAIGLVPTLVSAKINPSDVYQLAVCMRQGLSEARQQEARQPGFILSKDEREKAAKCIKAGGPAMRPILPLGQEVRNCLQEKWSDRFEQIVSGQVLPSVREAGLGKICLNLIKEAIVVESPIEPAPETVSVSYNRAEHAVPIRLCVLAAVGDEKYRAFRKGEVKLITDEKIAMDKCLQDEKKSKKEQKKIVAPILKPALPTAKGVGTPTSPNSGSLSGSVGAVPVPPPVVIPPPPPPAPPPPTYQEIQDCIKNALGTERYNDSYRRGYEMKADESIKIANCKARGKAS